MNWTSPILWALLGLWILFVCVAYTLQTSLSIPTSPPGKRRIGLAFHFLKFVVGLLLALACFRPLWVRIFGGTQ